MSKVSSTPPSDDPKTRAEASRVSAEARTAKAEALKADQQAADAQQKQLSALLPDPSKVTPGSLETKGEQPLFGAALAQRAMAAAAAAVAELAGAAIIEPGSARILVTSDAELANSDAIYVEVMTGLEQLNAAAEKLVNDVEPPELPSAAALAFAAPAVIGAVSTASLQQRSSPAS